MNWRALVLRNFWWKLTSLVLATIVWFTFRSGGLNINLRMPEDLVSVVSSREFIRHPLTVMKSAGDDRTFRVQPQEVDLTITAPPALLRELSGSDIRAFVDVTRKMEAGRLKIEIYAPSGVKLEKANPPEARVEEVKP